MPDSVLQSRDGVLDRTRVIIRKDWDPVIVVLIYDCQNRDPTTDKDSQKTVTTTTEKEHMFPVPRRST